MFRLTFDPGIVGKERFAICHQAIFLTDRPIADVGEEDDVLSILRKMKSISDETEEVVGKHHLRELRKEGGELLLERSEMRLLQECLKRPIWRVPVLEAKRQVQDWLGSLKGDDDGRTQISLDRSNGGSLGGHFAGQETGSPRPGTAIQNTVRDPRRSLPDNMLPGVP